MSNETLRQNAFSLSWERNPEPQTSIVDGFYPMRVWQKKAFETLCDKTKMILNAPMGGGKSWLMCLLSAHKLSGNSSLRAIIAVPQTIIAPGFTDAKLEMPDGECVHWRITHNLCRKETSKGTVKYIINWLSQQQHALNDRVLLCTHATLVQAYKKLKTENQLHLLTDLLLWIDEAHHVKNIAMEDIQGEVISNGIGELVRHLLNQTGNHIQLGLTTASFFRGDRCSLLTPSMEAQFSRFNLPYDEYLQSMKHLKSFSFDFLLCGHDYTNAIGILAKQKSGKDIIYVPHPKSRHSTGDKYQEVKSIFTEYQKIHGGDLVDTSDGLTLLHGSKNNFKMLDLVDEDQRVEKKEFLNNPVLKEQRESLDVIIALGMFKEGANWIWADRSIIVGVRTSLLDVVQMMGRLFRDVEDKYHVEVIQLLPFSLDQQSEDFRDNLNNYLKAIYASLILEDVLNPVKITVPFSHKAGKDPEKAKNGKAIVSMNDLIPDESTRLSVIEDVINRLASISDNSKKESKGIAALYEEYQATLPEVLQEYGITNHIEEIGEKIWSMLLRRSSMIDGIAVEDIDFEIVHLTHPLEGLLRYTSKACGVATLTQLRAAIHSWVEEKNSRWDFYYGVLEKYVEKHGTCRVHKDHEIIVNGKVTKLGSWYSDQKKNFQSLPQSKQERLQKLPEFIAKKFQRNKSLTIDEWIDLFISVSKQLNTPLIANTHIENGYNLGAWMQHIRKDREWNKLPFDQKQRLLDHNFKLSPKEEWTEAAVLAMSQFVSREQKTIPKSKHKEELVHKGIKYSIRLDNLRNKIKKTPEAIDPSILEGVKNIPNFFEELKETGETDVTYLDRGLKYYEKFKNRTGLMIIPQGHIEEGFDLFAWNKRVSSRKQLTQAFKNDLLKIDPHFFSKHVVRNFMQDILPQIEGFIQENGHALIPQGYVCIDGYLLGEKVADLRERKSKLPKEIVEQLDSLSDKWTWNCFERIHLQNMKELISYLEDNGYQQKGLPKKIRELCSKIKKILSKYPLSEPLKIRIEELAPGIFDEPKNENYLALLRYAEREGHACPPIKHVEDGNRIGLHVSSIRQKYKNSRLSADEQGKYESLKGWLWDASKLQSSITRQNGI